MFHISKENVAIKLQVKNLLNVNSLEIIWASFLSIIINKLLRKPALVRKSLFHLFWHWFLTLSFLHRTLAIERYFCKVTGGNGKKLLAENFLIYQKGISPMDVFIILKLSKSVRFPCNWFSSENKERENCTKLKYTIFRYYIFPDGSVWLMDNLSCLCDVWNGWSYVNSNFSASSIFSNGQFYPN